MTLRTIARLIVVGLFSISSSSFAHHSFTAEFDSEKTVELKGIVTKVEWTNPHVWIYINVVNETTGDVTNWGGEMGPPHGLQRRGWRRNTLSIGTEITMDGFLARNGSNRVSARNITIAATGERPSETLDADSSRQQGD